MASTNAQLLRQVVGDGGVHTRDVANGDGASTEFYLTAPPVAGNSQIIKVGGTTYTEVASAPGATQYTFDDLSGQVIFGAAPGIGTANIVAVYRAVEVPDADIVEALRQYGLVETDPAATGMPVAVLQAALLVCESRAAYYATHVDHSIDGQSISEGSIADRWEKRAAALREKILSPLTAAAISGGIQSMPLIRIDGYNTEEVSTRDVSSTAQNPRRRFYGEQDRIP